MKIIGIISREISTRNRILAALNDQGLEGVIIHSSGHFDLEGFDLFLVDMDAPLADLILKDHASKCIAFGHSNESLNIAHAKKYGCEKIYGTGHFYQKILPHLKDV